MAVPTPSITTTTWTASSTSHTINLPSYSAGQWVVIILMASGNNLNALLASPWTLLTSQTNNSSFTVYTKKMDGSEGSTVTATTSVARTVYGWAASFTNAYDRIPSAVSIASNNPPAHNPPHWDTEECLWISCVRATNAGSGYAANYTGNQLDLSDTAHRGFATRSDLGAVASEDVGAWTGYTGDASSASIAILSADATPRPYYPGTLANINGGNPTWSADLVEPNDIIVVQLENGDANVPTISGYTQALRSTSTTAFMTVLYKVADGTETGCTISGNGSNHFIGTAMRIRGCDPTTPIHTSTTSNEEVADATISIAGVTTTIDDCLLQYFNADGLDNSTAARATSWANASLTDVVEAADFGADSGNGGGIASAVGGLQVAGASGTMTATQFAAGVKSHGVIAWKTGAGLSSWASMPKIMIY